MRWGECMANGRWLLRISTKPTPACEFVFCLSFLFKLTFNSNGKQPALKKQHWRKQSLLYAWSPTYIIYTIIYIYMPYTYLCKFMYSICIIMYVYIKHPQQQNGCVRVCLCTIMSSVRRYINSLQPKFVCFTFAGRLGAEKWTSYLV